MNNSTQHGTNVGWVAAAAAAAVFAADWLTPLGVLDFALYVPICLVYLRMAGVRLAVAMTAFCSVLIVVGLFVSPPRMPFEWAVVNHVIGLVCLWLALWAGVSFGTRSGQLSEALRQSQQFLNSVLENLPDMVFVKDATDLRFVQFNKAGEELLGKNDYDFFPKHGADCFTAKDREVLSSWRQIRRWGPCYWSKMSQLCEKSLLKC